MNFGVAAKTSQRHFIAVLGPLAVAAMVASCSSGNADVAERASPTTDASTTTVSLELGAGQAESTDSTAPTPSQAETTIPEQDGYPYFYADGLATKSRIMDPGFDLDAAFRSSGLRTDFVSSNSFTQPIVQDFCGGFQIQRDLLRFPPSGSARTLVTNTGEPGRYVSDFTETEYIEVSVAFIDDYRSQIGETLIETLEESLDINYTCEFVAFEPEGYAECPSILRPPGFAGFLVLNSEPSSSCVNHWDSTFGFAELYGGEFRYEPMPPDIGHQPRDELVFGLRTGVARSNRTAASAISLHRIYPFSRDEVAPEYDREFALVIRVSQTWNTAPPEDMYDQVDRVWQIVQAAYLAPATVGTFENVSTNVLELREAALDSGWK